MEVRSQWDRAGGAQSSCARATTDERGVFVSIEPSFTGLLGWAPEEVIGRRLGELAHHEDLTRGLSAWAEMLKQPGGTSPRVRLRYRHRNGDWVWLDVVSYRRGGPADDVVTDMVDARSERELLQRLQAGDQLLAHLSDASGVGIFHAGGDGSIRYVSRRLEEITSTRGAATVMEQLGQVAEEDRSRLAGAIYRAARDAPAQDAAARDEEVPVDLAAGGRRWRVTLRPLRAGDGTVTGVSGTLEDVTPAVVLPATDPVTGCLTVDATLAALEELVKSHCSTGRFRIAGGRRQGDGRGTAVLVIAVGELQSVVERDGQGAGDELLQLVALRIVDAVRSSDVVGRTGGAEFAVLCAGVPGATTALSIGRSLQKQIAEPVVLKEGGPLTIRPGMGVSWTSQSGVRAVDLLRQGQEAAFASRLSRPPEPVLASDLPRLTALGTAASPGPRAGEPAPVPHRAGPAASHPSA